MPRGETGFVADNKYFVERQGGVCRVGIPSIGEQPSACYLGEPSPEYKAFEWRGAFYYDGYD